MPAEVQQRFDRLRGTRDAQAGRLAIEPTLIASRASLEALARDGDAARARLLPWQRTLLFGE
jgi:ribonuclease D